jgi:hypothetical protein
MAVKQSESFAVKLQAIIDAAPALRAAGVTSVGGDVAFTLAPADPPPPRPDGRVDEEPDIDDLKAFRGQRSGAS